MKKVGSIVIILLGILLFRVGFILLDQIKKDKTKAITEAVFYTQEIDIKGINRSTGITPNFLFHTIPNMNSYPKDKILYFRTTNELFKNNNAIITTQIIQNREIIFNNRFYFTLNKKVELFKIVREDLTTGSILSIKNENEIDSFLKTYKGFIDLLVIYNLEQ